MIATDIGMGAPTASCRGLLIIVWVCAAITVAVLTTMIYSIIACRKADSEDAATDMSSKSAQVLWSLIPIGIFLGIAVPVVKELLFTDHRCGL